MKYSPLLPSLSRLDLTVIWGGSIFLGLKFLPNDKLPGRGTSSQWDWCSCQFYCHLQHKWTAMPTSLSSCWRQTPNVSLEGTHQQTGPQLPASPAWGRRASNRDGRSQRTVLDYTKAGDAFSGPLQAAQFGICWLIFILTALLSNCAASLKNSHELSAHVSSFLAHQKGSLIAFNIQPACDQKSFWK